MYFVVGLIALIPVFLLVFRKGDFLLPSRFYGIFAVLVWSPVCLINPSRTHVESFFIGEEAQVRFLVLYVSVMIFSTASWMVVGFLSSKYKLAMSLDDKVNDTFCRIALGLSVFLVFAYLADPSTRRYLLDIFGYVTGGGNVSYKDIRRSFQYGGLHGVVHARLQYSLAFFLFLVLVWKAVVKRSVVYSIASFVLFVVCATSMSKMPYLYFGLGSFILVCLCFYKPALRKYYIFGAPVVLALGVVFAYLLYKVQYRDVAQVGDSDLLETMLFRVLEAYPDGCKLYVELFPETFPFTYGRTSQLLAPMLGYYGTQPMYLVPEYFGMETTFPGGVASYAYADFGLIGVVVYSMFVGALLAFLDLLTRNLKAICFNVGVPVSLALSLSTLWFWTKSFTTCLLTGGLALIPIMVLGMLVVSVGASRENR